MLLIVSHPPYLNNRFKSVIEKNERDGFICLMSMILVGENMKMEEKKWKIW